MATGQQERIQEREAGVDWRLWFGVLAGPIAWTMHLIISYILVRPVCLDGGNLAMHVVSLGLVLVAVAAAAVSWREWRGTLEPVQADIDGVGSRVGFMALYGMLSGGLFAVAIIVAWVPIFLIDPCLAP